MEFKVNRERIYALADALGLTLKFDHKTQTITGEMTKDVKIGPVALPMKMNVVSALLLDEVYMIVVKSTGNLALFVTAKYVKALYVVELHIIDRAKMKGNVELWLEREKPVSVNAALQALGPAVVRSFIKDTKDAWTETEIAA